MTFRHLQAFSSVTLLLAWILRCATAPHWHSTMLVAIVLVTAASEVGYRAGLKERSRERS